MLLPVNNKKTLQDNQTPGQAYLKYVSYALLLHGVIKSYCVWNQLEI